MECPFCCNPVPDPKAEICPSCNKPLDEDPRLAELDTLAENIRFRHEKLIKRGMIPILVLAVTSTFIPKGPFVGAIIMIVHAFMIRNQIGLPVRRMVSQSRRLMAKWVPRAAFLVIGAKFYVLLALPGVVLVTWPLAYWGLTKGLYLYLARSLRMERNDEPIEFWEKLLLGGVGCLAIVVLGVLLVAAIAVGVTVECFMNVNECFSGFAEFGNG